MDTKKYDNRWTFLTEARYWHDGITQDIDTKWMKARRRVIQLHELSIS